MKFPQRSKTSGSASNSVIDSGRYIKVTSRKRSLPFHLRNQQMPIILSSSSSSSRTTFTVTAAVVSLAAISSVCIVASFIIQSGIPSSHQPHQFYRHCSRHNPLSAPSHSPPEKTKKPTTSALGVVTDPTRLALTETKLMPSTTTRIRRNDSRINSDDNTNLQSRRRRPSSPRKATSKRKHTNSRKGVTTVVNRAALEDLYLLQSALKQLDVDEQRLPQSYFDRAVSSSRTRNMNVVDDVGLDNVLSSSSKGNERPSPTLSQRSTKAPSSSSSSSSRVSARMKRSSPSSSLSSSVKMVSSRQSQKGRTSKTKDLDKPTHAKDRLLRERSAMAVGSPKFLGLTVNNRERKNRKNKKRLSSIPPTERNPYLYPIPDDSSGIVSTEILALDDEEETPGEQQDRLSDSGLLLDVSAVEVLDDGSSVDETIAGVDLNPSARSSTMHGYGRKAVSDRQKAYDDGIRLVEGLSGQRLIESSETKNKRADKNGAHMYKVSASVPESLMDFAHEIHAFERITPKEEKELGKKTQEAIKLQRVYDGLQIDLDREPTDEEWCAAAGKINMEAISQIVEEGLDAKNRLVMANLRMVQGVVNVYIRNGLEGNYNAGDLMQEGIMALIRAAEKFDPSRGFRFSTYAMYWIRSAIKRDQLYQSRVVSVPVRMYEDHKRLIRIQNELKSSLHRSPTKREVADATGFSVHQIDTLMKAMSQQEMSFDQTLLNPMKPMRDGESKETLLSLVASKVDENDYSMTLRSRLRDDLIKTLHEHLTEEEALVLMLRFGLVDGQAPVRVTKRTGLRTFSEVARLVGLKPDKVRRIIQKSLDHLQSVMGDEWIDYELETKQ